MNSRGSKSLVLLCAYVRVHACALYRCRVAFLQDQIGLDTRSCRISILIFSGIRLRAQITLLRAHYHSATALSPSVPNHFIRYATGTCLCAIALVPNSRGYPRSDFLLVCTRLTSCSRVFLFTFWLSLNQLRHL